jgi:hypothetical protein
MLKIENGNVYVCVFFLSPLPQSVAGAVKSMELSV